MGTRPTSWEWEGKGTRKSFPHISKTGTKCPFVRLSVRANIAQSVPLGRRRRHLACILYGSGTQILRSRIVNFGACAAGNHPQLTPAGPAVRCQDFQNLIAPAPLGRHRCHLARIILYRGQGTRSRMFNFGACAPRHRPQLSPATFTDSV